MHTNRLPNADGADRTWTMPGKSSCLSLPHAKPEIMQFVQEAAEQENRSMPNFVETVLLAEKRRREARAKPPNGTD